MKNIPLSTMRKIIAENMTKSKREIPHFYITAEVDMTDKAFDYIENGKDE